MLNDLFADYTILYASKPKYAIKSFKLINSLRRQIQNKHIK